MFEGFRPSVTDDFICRIKERHTVLSHRDLWWSVWWPVAEWQTVFRNLNVAWYLNPKYMASGDKHIILNPHAPSRKWWFCDLNTVKFMTRKQSNAKLIKNYAVLLKLYNMHHHHTARQAASQHVLTIMIILNHKNRFHAANPPSGPFCRMFARRQLPQTSQIQRWISLPLLVQSAFVYVWSFLCL